MEYTYTRTDIDFYSEGTRCSAWLYLPDTPEKPPVIVMAHGLGGTREMRLYEYAERFAAAGYACFLFDYRNYGSSDGNRRQLINVRMQLKDWNNAIGFIKKNGKIDPRKLLLFGSSFSGGHVVWLSAHRNDVKGAVAQCPYTDTMATIKVVGLPYIVRKAPFVIADEFTRITGYHPVMLKLSTFPGTGENAFMEADEDTTERFIDGAPFINEAPARTLMEFVKYSPGRFFKDVKNPIYVAACAKDNLAPAGKTLRLAKKAEHLTCKTYDCGHFNIYLSPFFEEVIEDYVNFYNQIKY